jgi:type IV pilus assembly protein PilM
VDVFGGKHRSRCPIGLDIGARYVRLLQLERRGESWRVIGAAKASMPAEAIGNVAVREQYLADTLPALLAAGDFSGRQVVVSLPATSVIYKNLRVPHMPADELKSAVEWEASDRLRIDSHELRLQFFDAGEVRQGDDLREEIILLAVSRTEIETHVDTLVRCQLKPAAIEVVPSALARALDSKECGNIHESGMVVVDVGYSSTKVMVTRHGRIAFFKLIEVGGKDIDKSVAGHLNLPPVEIAAMRRQIAQSRYSPGEAKAELFGGKHHDNLERTIAEAMRGVVSDLAREIALCLRYYSVTFRGARPEVVKLVGGEAHDPQLSHILAESAGVVTEPANPLQMVDPASIPQSDDFQGMNCDWAVAAGLSMREVHKAHKRGAA